MGINQIIGKEEIIGPGNNKVVVVTANGTRHLSYDYLILAAGSSLKAVNLPGNWAKVLPSGLNCPKAWNNQHHDNFLYNRDNLGH